MANPETVYAVIRSIRANFNRLKAVGDSLHEDIDVTSAMRAVMESLSDAGDQTVPDIARSKSVSRQHVQTLADQLADAGLVTFKENPAHKRSSLLSFTKQGQRTFAQMRKRESSVLQDIAEGLTERDVAVTLRTLEALQAKLDAILNQGENHDT